MTIRHLRMFVTVCETGSVTKAAEQLYIAQPTISHAIAELEKYYNIHLFDRINQRLVLTDTGRELLVTAKEILSGFENFEKLASFGSHSARVHIGASMTLGQTVMPPFLSRMHREHPEIEVQVVIKPSASIQAEIENGNLDFAVIEGEVSSPYLTAELFQKDRLLAVAYESYPVATSLTIEELAKHPLLLRDHGSASRNFLEKEMVLRGVHPKIVMESVNDQALITAVYASLGISVLPESFVQGHISRGRFKEIKIEGLDSSRGNYLVRHKNKKLNKAKQIAYEMLMNDPS